jgi:hypothetical protein
VLQRVSDLTVQYEDTLSGIAVGIEQACQASDLCHFSPVQLVYLGHTDLDEIDSLSEDIKNSLQAIGLSDRFVEIRQAAENLRERPDDYKNQMRFREKILRAVENTNRLEAAIQDTFPKLSQKIGAVKIQLEILRKSVFGFPVSQTSDELLNKNQIILARLNTDLATLAEVQTNRELILQRFELIKPLLRELSGPVLNEDHSPEEWRRSASQVLIFLDQVETSTKP